MRATSVSGIVTRDVPVSYWPIVFFALALVTVPEVFAKVNSAQFSYFINGQLLDRDHSRVRQILQFQPSSSMEVTHPWHG